MTIRLAQIRRHPIKGIGSEALDAARLSPEGALEGDRAWALLNAAAPDLDDWQPRRNFLVVARGPALAPVRAETRGDRIALSHPERPGLVFDPAHEADALRDWVAPLWPEDSPPPARLVRAPCHGMTDMQEAYVSIGSLGSLDALSDHAGLALDLHRFRINLWIEGLEPWAETGWIGQRLRLGEVELEVAEPIGRCRAPEANPDTGLRDANTNRLLTEIGQGTDFGVYARVTRAGTVCVGDVPELI